MSWCIYFNEKNTFIFKIGIKKLNNIKYKFQSHEMSASLVRQALELVDPSLNLISGDLFNIYLRMLA